MAGKLIPLYGLSRDPRKGCGSFSPFARILGYDSAKGYQYNVAKTAGLRKQKKKLDFGEFIGAAAFGGVVGGVTSAAFYGTGKGIAKLKDSFWAGKGRRTAVATPNHGQGFSDKGYNPQPGERTFDGYVNANISQEAEIKLFTHSEKFNTNPKNDGHFKRYGTKPNQHGIEGPHVHQPTRTVNPHNGIITGKPASKTKNNGVTEPKAKDIKQLYEYLENSKYH